MFTIISMPEKIFRGLKVSLKLLYYRLKYGKRLKIGKNLHFRKGFIINISKNGFLEIGNNNFFNNYCSINCRDKITIGNDNLFGENVKIYDHNHIFNNKNLDIKTNFKTHPITIGDKNWFASNVIILSKAEIGDNSVIGAATAVNERLPSNSLAKNHNSLIVEQIRYK